MEKWLELIEDTKQKLSEKETMERLEKVIAKKTETMKRLTTLIRKYSEKLWDLKDKRCTLSKEILLAKEVLGRLKMEKCGVVKEFQRPWGFRYVCEARDLKYPYFSYLDILTKYCWKCKWTPEQAQARQVMLKIRGKKDE